jgi:hypothetical protein
MPFERVQIRQLAKALKVIPFKIAIIRGIGVNGYVPLEQVPSHGDA